MGTPFIGEIRIIGFNFPPKGWAFCNGQLLAINQNQALFSILGTTYGGNGTTNFALPNLQGQAAIHMGQGPGLSNYNLGQTGGEAGHTLTINEMPNHVHTTVTAVKEGGNSATPQNTRWAASTQDDTMYNGTTNSSMSPAAIGTYGGSQPHENRQPYLTLNYIIALQGIFPSRN